ncbi:MAG TPA: hypothetical protein VLN48_07120 [Bryobacteraceae bacterium]|nr:hypothetical protein [Bryobacteraceae bacterium]
MTEREIQDLLREMRDEPVPVDSLARVRLGVEQGTSKRNWWKFAVPIAVAASVVAGFLLLRPAKAPGPIEQPMEQSSTPEIAQVVIPREIPVRVAQTAPRPRRVRPRPQRVEVVPVSIRIETPDPDVVILFVN